MSLFYQYSLILIFSFAVIILALLFFVTAPYGKFQRKGWGPVIKTRWAWMIMEFPSPALMIFIFILSGRYNLMNTIFLVLWSSHYLHRTFVYPFSQSGGEKPYPLLLVLMALIFNCLNGFVNGYGIFHLYYYTFSWMMTWKFNAGLILFITGFIINKRGDARLRKLRRNKPDEYVIPHGWLFRYVSSPHYLGEIIEWTGWAIMTWSLPGLAFAVFTFANLFPRAIRSHRWYRERFPDYPPERKALIPFIV